MLFTNFLPSCSRRLALCVIVVLHVACPLHAQQLNGNVKDKNGSPLPNAEVLLTDTSGKLIWKTALADIAGHFTIPYTPNDTSGLILVQLPGYNALTIPLSGIQPEVALDITLEQLPATMLKEVTVSGSKPLLERKTDRIIFNVQNSIVAIGGTVLDAVGRSPGISVNASTGSITLAGKSAIQVMVNGKLLQLSGEDLTAYLQSLPASRLEHIEVITAPPAQYDASGNSGLINLVLKKEHTAGVSGDARLGIEQASYPTGITGGSLNYRKNKLNIYTNASYSSGSKWCIERLTTFFPGREFALEDHYRKDVQTGQLTAGADYELNRGSVAGIQYTGNVFNRQNNDAVDMRNYTLPGRRLDSLVYEDANSTQQRTTHLLNINYDWAIDSTGKKLSVNANHLWLTNVRHRRYDATGFIDEHITPTGSNAINRNEGNQTIDISTAQADVTLPTRLLQISFGGKLSFINNESSNGFFSYIHNTWIEEPGISNRFRYEEKVQAIYAGMQKDVKEWSFQAGLRGEFTQTSGHSFTTQQQANKRYFQLFPSLYISYTANENHTFNINYTKRINRPGYNDLDPFRSYSSPYSYIEGNPFLNPSYNHNIEFNYTLQSRYTFSAFYQYEQNHFGQVFLVDTLNNATSVTRANFANLSMYGITIVAAFQPQPWWELQLVGSGFIQTVYDDKNRYIVTRLSASALFLQTTNSFVLKKDRTLLAELSIWYQSPNQPEFLYFRSSGSVDAGLKALFFNKKLTVSLNGTDLFKTQRVRGTHQVTGQVLNSYFDTRNVRLLLQYKFGGKTKAARKRDTGIEAEKERT